MVADAARARVPHRQTRRRIRRRAREAAPRTGTWRNEPIQSASIDAEGAAAQRRVDPRAAGPVRRHPGAQLTRLGQLAQEDRPAAQVLAHLLGEMSPCGPGRGGTSAPPDPVAVTSVTTGSAGGARSREPVREQRFREVRGSERRGREAARVPSAGARSRCSYRHTPSSAASYPRSAGPAGRAGWATVTPCRPSPSTTPSSRTSSPRCGTSAPTPHLPAPGGRAGHPARLRGHPRRPGRPGDRQHPARRGAGRPAGEARSRSSCRSCAPGSGCWTA